MGSGFIKICTYFPYPVNAWINGHEWAKRQALAAGIGFTALSNGFASCDDPAALQATCGAASGGARGNREPDTGPGARARKGADVGMVDPRMIN